MANKNPAYLAGLNFILLIYTERVTNLERRQRVHTFARRTWPFFSTICTFFTLARQILLARRDTWLRVMLTRWPVWMDLSHTSHLAMDLPP